MRSQVMRNGAAAGGGLPRAALALLLCGTALFLAVENTLLLFVLGPVIDWPARLEMIGVALRVVRVLAGAFAPWLTLGAAAVLAGATAAWALLRLKREVARA